MVWADRGDWADFARKCRTCKKVDACAESTVTGRQTKLPYAATTCKFEQRRLNNSIFAYFLENFWSYNAGNYDTRRPNISVDLNTRRPSQKGRYRHR